jgi:hypothetical protein
VHLRATVSVMHALGVRGATALILLLLLTTAALANHRVVLSPEHYGARLARSILSPDGGSVHEHYWLRDSVYRGKHTRGIAMLHRVATDEDRARAAAAAANATGVREDAYADAFQHISYLQTTCAEPILQNEAWRWEQQNQIVVIESANPLHLPRQHLLDMYALAAARWQFALSGLFSVFGTVSPLEVSLGGISMDAPNGENALVLGEISSPGALGVAVVWASGETIVEADIALDVVDFLIDPLCLPERTEQFCLNATLQHEIGHALGMGHAIGSACIDHTMWPTLSSGDDVKVTTLEVGDVCGVRELYGETPAAGGAPCTYFTQNYDSSNLPDTFPCEFGNCNAASAHASYNVALLIGSAFCALLLASVPIM